MKAQRNGKIQSINFEDRAHELLTKAVNKQGSNYSQQLNRLIYAIFGMDPDVKKELAVHSYQKYMELQNKAANSSGFYREAYKNQSEQYMEFMNLLTDNRGVVVQGSNMQRVDMHNAFLICPDDWIILNVTNPEQASEAYVIEFRNSEKFKLPHFIFFSNEEPDEEFKSVVLDVAAERSESFKRVRLMYQDTVFSKEGHFLNATEYFEQPVPGFFKIPTLGSETDYPYGAMIVREEVIYYDDEDN